jgi:hypothetical protein
MNILKRLILMIFPGGLIIQLLTKLLGLPELDPGKPVDIFTSKKKEDKLPPPYVQPDDAESEQDPDSIRYESEILPPDKED